TVGMTNGQLSIVAENSTLSDVLIGVHKATGAAVELPPASGSERVVVRLGPGQPRDVLQQLLAGSKFDYIIVGTPQNDASISRVILTARNGGSTPAALANQRYTPPTSNTYQPADDSGDDDTA